MNPYHKGESTKDRRKRFLQMCLWSAEMKTAQEVADLITATYGLKYTRQAAHQFVKTQRWSKIIKRFRKTFLTDLTRIPIANKSVRLERLNTVYEESMTESLKSINKYGEVYEIKVGAAATALSHARVEMEGERPIEVNTKVTLIQHLHKAKSDRFAAIEGKEFDTADRPEDSLRVVG